MSTTCYTAIYGGYDPELLPAPIVPNVQFVCFTDNPKLKGSNWDVRVAARPEQHPRMQAKWFKLHPHIALCDSERTLWIDGNVRIKSAEAFEQVMSCAEETGIALHDHPGRCCIYAEAKASMRYQKYQGLHVLEQAEQYRREGHPENWGLWACGMIARKRSEDIDAVMNDWWNEIVMWTYQDQVSFPVVVRRAGIRPVCFPHDQLLSPWFQLRSHARED